MTTTRLTSLLSALLVAATTLSTNVFACNGPAGFRGGFAPRFQPVPQAQVTPFQLWQFLCKNPHLCAKHPALALQLQKQFGPIPGATPAAVPTPVVNARVAPPAAVAPVAPVGAVNSAVPGAAAAAAPVPANAVAPAPVAAVKPPAPPVAPAAVVSNTAAPSAVPANEVAIPITPETPAAPVTVAAPDVPKAAAPVPAPAAPEETPVVENKPATTTPDTFPDDLPIGEDVGG